MQFQQKWEAMNWRQSEKSETQYNEDIFVPLITEKKMKMKMKL